jgi:hypothetical protein
MPHFGLLVMQLLWWGTRWRSWLMHCATSGKVAGSIPDGVAVMALGLTQPLTEMSTSNNSWGVKTTSVYG